MRSFTIYGSKHGLYRLRIVYLKLIFVLTISINFPNLPISVYQKYTQIGKTSLLSHLFIFRDSKYLLIPFIPKRTTFVSPVSRTDGYERSRAVVVIKQRTMQKPTSINIFYLNGNTTLNHGKKNFQVGQQIHFS